VLATVVLGLLAMGVVPQSDAPAVRPVQVTSGRADAPAAKQLQERLSMRGIQLTDGHPPAWLNVHVAAASRGLHLLLSDAEGRVAERTVSNVEIASVVVEAWMRTDITWPDPPLPPSDPGLEATSLTPSEPSIAPPGVAAPGSPLAQAGIVTSVAASAETSLGPDRSVWMGGAADLRHATGPVWLTLTLRMAAATALASDPQPLYKGESKGSLQRLGGDLLLGVARPISLGRPLLVPQLAAGMGLYDASADHESHHGRATALGVRVEPAISLAWRLRGAWWLEARASVTFAPLIRAEAYTDGDFEIPREPPVLGHIGIGIGHARFDQSPP
jgi:hypothetical protein